MSIAIQGVCPIVALLWPSMLFDVVSKSGVANRRVETSSGAIAEITEVGIRARQRDPLIKAGQQGRSEQDRISASHFTLTLVSPARI
jgi:hypothetical protein